MRAAQALERDVWRARCRKLVRFQFNWLKGIDRQFTPKILSDRLSIVCKRKFGKPFQTMTLEEWKELCLYFSSRVVVINFLFFSA